MRARSASSPSSPLLAARTGSWDLGPMREHAGAGAAVLAGAGRFRREGGHVSAAHLAALGARQCAEPRLGHHVGRGDQDGHLRPRALQRLAAGAGGGGLGGDRARRDERGARASPSRSAQNDFKRLLAYCSVENIGIILIGLGGALLAVDARRRALGPAGAGRGAAARLESRRVQGAAVLRRRLGAARHGHAGDEPARRTVARDAVDGGAVRARLGRRFGSAAAQRVCQRMAGVSRACSMR